jgi:hypothetical protein
VDRARKALRPGPPARLLDDGAPVPAAAAAAAQTSAEPEDDADEQPQLPLPATANPVPSTLLARRKAAPAPKVKRGFVQRWAK